jgi:hypothetical protein
LTQQSGWQGGALSSMVMEDQTEPSNELRSGYGEVVHACAGRRGRHAPLVVELMRAVHARDAFIAIAAHELRNPNDADTRICRAYLVGRPAPGN